MKVLILFALVALASCEIDWSTVKPIRKTKEWQEAFPNFAANTNSLETIFDLPPQRGGRVVRGDFVGPTDIPYQVGLIIHFNAANGWCSGSLVSLNFILTTASCFPSYVAATVLLGATDISRMSDVILASTLRRHEDFDPDTFENDIALLRLSHSARLNAEIQIVRLPNLRQIPNRFENFGTLFAGWGRTNTGANEAIPTPRLTSVTSPTITNTACRIRFPSSVFDSTICTAVVSGSPCDGDEGGPLTIQEDQRTQIGILSFTFSVGCDLGWPPVYTRLTSFLSWIGAHSDVHIRPDF